MCYFVQLFIFVWIQNVSYGAIPSKFKSGKVEYIWKPAEGG